MADRSSFWNCAGHPVFGNDRLGTALAILFNNQGLVKDEFRAGLALVRVAESTVTAIVYFHLGLFLSESQSLMLVIIPQLRLEYHLAPMSSDASMPRRFVGFA